MALITHLSEIRILLNLPPFCAGGNISFESSGGENGLLCAWLNVRMPRNRIGSFVNITQLEVIKFVYLYLCVAVS